MSGGPFPPGAYVRLRTEIRQQAVALLEGCEVDDLDDGADDSMRYKSLSHGPAPRIVRTDGLEGAGKEAITFIKPLRADDANASPSTVCVVASSEKGREAMAQQLRAAGFKGVTITAQSNHSDARDVVHFATMHRAKGLEFDAMVVVTTESYLGDPVETVNQRKLLYMALTRAKRDAVLIRLQ